MTAEDRNDGFLKRWSKRKRADHEAAETEIAPAGIPVADEVMPETGRVADAVREDQLQANREAAEAVEIDLLDENSDFTIFMKEGVPQLLRQQALRVLWRSNPVFANVDGLVEYGDDYASKDLVMKTFQSAWQAGRGYLKKELEKADEVDDAVPGVQDERANDVEPAPRQPAEMPEPGAEAGSELLETESAPDPVGESAAEPQDPAPAELVKTETPARLSLRSRLMVDRNS